MTDAIKNEGSGIPEKTDLQTLSFVTQQEFENWLEQYNTLTSGIWIRFFKKESKQPTISYNQALNVALCYGWIDGQVKNMTRIHTFRNSLHAGQKACGQKETLSSISGLKNKAESNLRGLKKLKRQKPMEDGKEPMIHPEIWWSLTILCRNYRKIKKL